MKNRYVKICFISILCLFLSLKLGAEDNKKNLQLDFQGDGHYSRFNFTDIKIPYSGFDQWIESRLILWLNKNKTFAPYISFIPSFSTESEFWWQRNLQCTVAIQYYPLSNAPTQYSILKSIRLFALYAWRGYSQKPAGVASVDTDKQIGLDFYYDNLFDNRRLTCEIWTNAGYRTTNFSLEDYQTFLWIGNVKIGSKFRPGKSFLLPYILVDWTYSARYKDRFWDNFLRTGFGGKVYPVTDSADGFGGGLVKRFHIYGEILYNAKWFGHKPPPGHVKATDFRFGFGFSTGGFYKEKK